VLAKGVPISIESSTAPKKRGLPKKFVVAIEGELGLVMTRSISIQN